MMSDEGLTTVQTRRRNGQKLSCENCRKVKVACDHALPHCGRCVRKNCTDTCVYHPAPMTGLTPNRNTRGSNKRIRRSPSSVEPAAKEQPEVDGEQDITMSSDPGHMLSNNDILSPLSAEIDRIPDSNREFLGATNYRSIFNEHQINFEQHSEAGNLEKTASPWEDSDFIRLAKTALQYIPTRNTCMTLIGRKTDNPSYTQHGPSLLLLHEGFWTTFQSILGEKGSPTIEGVLTMIRQISLNTMRQKKTIIHTSSDWIASFTGKNITWDGLSFLLVSYGKGFASTSTYDGILQNRDKIDVCREMGDSVKACLSICDRLDVLTLNVIRTRTSLNVLQNSYDGDDSRHNWTNNSLLTSNIYSLGLHLGIDEKPFIKSQLERQIYHLAFAEDKQVATSKGRPPQLSYRWNRCPLPLELSDEELMHEGHELQLVLDVLDSAGWRTDSNVYAISYLRVLAILGTFREEVLELTFGRPTGSSLQDQQIDIRTRLFASYDSLPSRLKFDKQTCDKLKPYDLLNIIWMRIEVLYSSFLLHRLSEMSVTNNHNLLNDAQRMLELLVYLHSRQDRFGDMNVFFPWALVFFGIPCSSVLAIDILLRHTTSHRIVSPPYSRSEVIQNLSIFIFSLKSISSSEGNYVISDRMSKVLQRILDQVLETPAQASVPSFTLNPSSSSFFTGSDIDMISFITPMKNTVFENWLESVDWTRSDGWSSFLNTDFAQVV